MGIKVPMSLEYFFLKKHRFVEWGIIACTVVVLNLFFVFGAQLFFEKPIFGDFCEDPQVKIIPQEKEECLFVGGQWVEDRYIQRGLPRQGQLEPPIIEKATEGYCNPDYTCKEEFSKNLAQYERNIFLILFAAGVLIFSFSFIPFFRGVLAASFGIGGIFVFIISSARHWPYMDEYTRVVMLAVGLAILIWIGIKKNRE